jgi:hypothetical protein
MNLVMPKWNLFHMTKHEKEITSSVTQPGAQADKIRRTQNTETNQPPNP